jgi:hypothetical protein
MVLEVFPKEALVGEMQFFGNYLDVLNRVPELYAYLQNGIIVNPFVGCAMTGMSHGFCQILRRDIKLLCIPADTPFVLEVHLHEFDELGEDVF